MSSNHQLKLKNNGRPKYKKTIDKTKLIEQVNRNDNILVPLPISKTIKLIKQNTPKKVKIIPKNPSLKLYDTDSTFIGIKVFNMIKRMNDPITKYDIHLWF